MCKCMESSNETSQYEEISTVLMDANKQTNKQREMNGTRGNEISAFQLNTYKREKSKLKFIRSSVISVQLSADYFVRLNVCLQLYNRMHMHVLQGIDVHYRMNFHN